jgi:hypothetical protein
VVIGALKAASAGIFGAGAIDPMGHSAVSIPPMLAKSLAETSHRGCAHGIELAKFRLCVGGTEFAQSL